MTSLPALDLAIIAVYVAGTVALGAWFARRQRDTNTYFVGGRNVSGWLVLISVVATETSTVTFLSVPGLAFKPDGGNLAFLQLTFGFLIGRCVVAWLLLPQYMNGEFLSAYQLLRQRFDTTVQRTASGIFLVTRTAADGLRLFLTALLLQEFVGWDMTVSVLVMGIATIVYTYLGGMEAVIWTDVIQFAVYMAGALVAIGFIVSGIDGGFAGFLEAGRESGKFQLLDLSLDPSRPLTLWAGLVGGAFLSMASHGADQLTVQRFLCARSLAAARASVVGSGLVVMVQFLLFLLIGAGLYVLWRQGGIAGLTEVLQEKKSNDVVFGYYIVHYLPTGLVGLLIAAVLSAAMSTLSASLNSSSNAVVNDFYRPLRPGRDEHHYLRVSRGMTTVWGAAQMGVALLAAAALRQSVVFAALSIAGFTTGIILGLFLLGRMSRPVSSQAALAGLIAGFLTVLVVWLPSLEEVRKNLPEGTPVLAWPWYAPLGAVTTVLVALLADRIARPGTTVA